MSQWESKYFSQILPFVFPRMCSGPDFNPDKLKWHRSDSSAEVTPVEFTKAMARRVEGQIRNDFAAVPIIRSVCYKWMIEHASTMIIPFCGQRDRPGSIIASDLMKAAQKLCETLQKGTITLQSGKKIPVAGDTTRLYQADGLTPLEKSMALNMHFLAKNQPGSQQLRQLMGHC